MALVAAASSRPFLRYCTSEEDSSSIRSIPSFSGPPSTPSDLSDTDSDDLGSSYRHNLHTCPRTRPRHGNRGGNGLGAISPPTLSINTNATVTTGQTGRDADLETLRHSLDALPAYQLREVILRVAFSSPRFLRAVRREAQAVGSGITGNEVKRDIMVATEGKASQTTEKTTTPKKRAPYVLQTPPITPTTPRSSAARKMESTRQMKDSDDEGEVPRGRPSWRAFRGCRLVKDSAEQTTSRKTRRHRRPVAGTNKPQSYSDGHVERKGSQVFERSHSSDTGRHVPDNGHYHPGYLRDEEYEFVSRSPDGAAYRVVRNVTMWSCCDEDAPSPGCVRSFFAASQARALLPTSEPNQFERPETPDSEMEETPFHSRPVSLDLGAPSYEDLMEDYGRFSVFGIAKLSELEMVHSVSTLGDVYPDSDLESPYSSTPISPDHSISRGSCA